VVPGECNEDEEPRNQLPLGTRRGLGSLSQGAVAQPVRVSWRVDVWVREAIAVHEQEKAPVAPSPLVRSVTSRSILLASLLASMVNWQDGAEIAKDSREA
jgi:hypothetical protein